MGLIFNDKSDTRSPHPPHTHYTSGPQQDSLLCVTNLVWTADYLCTVHFTLSQVRCGTWLYRFLIFALFTILVIHTTDPILPYMVTVSILSYSMLGSIIVTNFRYETITYTAKKVCTFTPNLVEDELSLTLVQSSTALKYTFCFDGSVPQNN